MGLLGRLPGTPGGSRELSGGAALVSLSFVQSSIAH